MQSIAGWLGSFKNIKNPQDTLVAMGNKACNSADNTNPIYLSEDISVIHTGATAYSNVAKEGNLLATYTGTPHWSNSDLQNKASSLGHANILIKAYKEQGIDMLDILHGSFAICIIDLNCNMLLLAIDRMGIQPMSYSSIDDKGIIFGSTADSITIHPSGHADIDMQTVYQYLFFHAVPCPHSIFKNQNKLKPGQFIKFQDGKSSTGYFWRPTYKENTNSSFKELKDRLISLLDKAVIRCNIDGNAGAFLSGGIDSSTISGVLSKISHSKVHTYSIGFDVKDYDEIEFARTTSEYFNTIQHEYYVTPQDVVDLIPVVAKFYDEPFGNSSVIPTYYCASLAKQNGTRLLMAGDGGDELFGGNARYAKQGVFELYNHIPELLRSSLLEPIIFKVPGLSSIKPFSKIKSYIEQAKIPMPDRLQTYNFLVRTTPEQVLHKDMCEVVNTRAPYDLLRHNYSGVNTDSMMHRMLYLDWIITLADNDLRKVNRMCDLAGVNVQYPLLDDDIVNFSTTLTSQYLVNGKQLRYFFKRAMNGFLPEKVLKKSKHGFGLPFGIWMKTYKPLKEIAYDNLTTLKKRNIINCDYIDQLIYKHQHEHAAYYGGFIWVLMMLELWLQTHVDQ